MSGAVRLRWLLQGGWLLLAVACQAPAVARSAVTSPAEDSHASAFAAPEQVPSGESPRAAAGTEEVSDAEGNVDPDEGDGDASGDGAQPLPGLLLRVRDRGREQIRRVALLADRWDTTLPVAEAEESRSSDEPQLGWQAEWTGLLLSQSPGVYRLAAYFCGDLQVTLAGQRVLSGRADQPQWIVSPPFTLPYDWHPLQVSLRASNGAQEPMLHVSWRGQDFPWEPIPARQLFHDPQLPGIAEMAEAAERVEQGFQLTQALRCTACHELPGRGVPHGPAAQGLEAPSLTAAALRHIDSAWLVEWLQASGQVSPERRMPTFPMSRGDAVDIAAYLKQRGEPAAGRGEESLDMSGTSAAQAQGEQLFLSRGCVACHVHGNVGKPTWLGGPNLTYAGDRWSASFFRRWLSDPASLDPQHRMPAFDLTELELAQLTTFLAASRSGKVLASGPASEVGDGGRDSSPNAARGRELVAAAGCAKCHAGLRSEAQPVRAPGQANAASIAKTNSAVPAELIAEGDPPPLSEVTDWSRGCVGPAAEAHPGYRMSAAQIEAIRAFVSSRRQVSRTSRIEQGKRVLAERLCLSCHARDTSAGLLPVASEGTRWHAELAANLPALLPPSLTSVGDKLTDHALAEAVTRQGPVVRDWLQVQMPRFRWGPAEVQTLIDYFVTADRLPPAHPQVSTAEAPPMAEAVSQRLVTPDGFGCTSCHAIGKVKPKLAPLGAQGPNLSQLGARIRRSWFDRWVRDPARIVPRMEMPSVQIPIAGVLDGNLERQLAAVWEVLNRPGFSPPEPDPVRVVRRSGIADQHEPAIALTDVLAWNQTDLIKPFLIGLPNRHNVLIDLETNRLIGWWLGDVARQRTKGKAWYWEPGAQNVWPGEPLWNAEEAAGNSTFAPPVGRTPTDHRGSDIVLVRRSDGQRCWPLALGQFVTEPASWTHAQGSLTLTHLLRFPSPDAARGLSAGAEPGNHVEVVVEQRFSPITDDQRADSFGTGWLREVAVEGIPAGFDAALRVVTEAGAGGDLADDDSRRSAGGNEDYWQRPAGGMRWNSRDGRLQVVCRIDGSPDSSLKSDPPPVIVEDGTTYVLLPPAKDVTALRRLTLAYRCRLPIDQFPPLPPLPAPPAKELAVVPGWRVTQLPIAADIMPTGLAWRPDGALVVCSLKGRVWLMRDTDGDGLEDSFTAFTDELAAPYGVVAASDHIDVVNKFGLLRLYDRDGDDFAEHAELIASGWGHTADYHDWAVGLVAEPAGSYVIATACQQDERSPAAAHWRGEVLRLRPEPGRSGRSASRLPLRCSVEPISSGHRFPMGLARNRSGDLFVTDNQGNFNPFNELNHIQAGKHYGFVNASDRGRGGSPPLTEPAINIPHPWTRSVNGICFLETPSPLVKQHGPTYRHFGTCEGHLLGCEYDTRRLIRCSLQRVGDTFQGAAYPLSDYPSGQGDTLLGPLVCGVAPDGDVYVGCLRDSGWGGANNTGTLLRMTFREAELPAGIAEVRATSQGFVIDFTAAVDRGRAGDKSNYRLASYRRVSTPAYGGDDLDRQNEPLADVIVAADARSVELRLPRLREGFVYEIRVPDLKGHRGERFFPAEAYYTLHKIPPTHKSKP